MNTCDCGVLQMMYKNDACDVPIKKMCEYKNENKIIIFENI